MVQFNIEVAIDPAKGRRGARALRGEVKGLETAAGKLKTALVGAVGILAGGALLTSATRTLAQFGQEMSTVAAITQSTGQQFDALNERAIQLGTATRFSATQAAEGMSFLARAGFNANEVYETVDDTLNLAQAGALGLGQAADIASNALTAFRLETDQAGRVVDVLAFAANNSNTTVAQLGDGLKLVAPIAAGVGVEIEETAGAIAALSNAGLQATLAGTGLRRIISELESPSAKTSKTLRGLGLETEDYKVSSVGLTQALKNLTAAGVDTGLGLEVFGDRGGPAFEVLSSSLGDVEEMTRLLQNADGTAARIAETMDDNLNGSLLAVKSAFEGLILRLGEDGATGSLRTFFDFLASGLRTAADNIGIFINVLEALAFVIGVKLAQQAIPAAGRAIDRFTLALFRNPAAIFVGGLTLAVAGLIAFQDQITLTADSTTTLGDVFSATFDVLGGIANELGKEMVDVFNALNDVLGGVFNELEFSVQGVLELAATVADRTLGLFQGLGNALITLFTGIGPAAADVFIQGINGLLLFIDSGIALTRAAFGTVGETSRKIGESVLEFFSGIGAALALLVTGQTDAALDAAELATKIFGGNLRLAMREIPDTFDQELEKVANADILGQLENPFTSAASDLGTSVTDSFFEGLNVTLVTGVLDEIVAKADDARASAEAAAAASEGVGGAPGASEGEAGAAGGSTAPVGLLSPEALEQLQAIEGVENRLADTQAALNELFDAGRISAEEYAVAMNSAGIATDDLGSSITGGLKAGLDRTIRDLSDTAAAAENLAVNGFNAVEGALVQFVTTGELDFSAFVDGLIADIARLIVKILLLKAIEAIGGGFGAAFGGAVEGAAAAGGDIAAGQPFLVGEEGPEIFTPTGGGNITPAGETAARMSGGGGQAPQVNVAPAQVNVMVVNDPNDIPAGIESPDGEQAIMRVLSKRRTEVRGITAG